MPRLRSLACLFLLCGMLLAAPVRAQTPEMVAVTVGDSPVAWQLFQQALDQAKDNPSEAARLCQRLLDGFADRVIPGEDHATENNRTADRFESVLERVERFLREHRAALERYRQIEGPEAERLAATESPESIARTRGLTRAGLRATLTLAERDLLAGSFERVLARLDRVAGHPDLVADSGDTIAFWYLRGAAAALGGHSRERDEALARLAALGAEAIAASDAVGKLSQVEPARVATTTNVLGAGEAPADVDDGAGGWQPIWSIPLSGTPFARIFSGPIAPTPRFDPLNPNLMEEQAAGPQQYDRARYDGSMLCVAPAVSGDAVIVSDGSTLMALDRLSHRTKWVASIGTLGGNRDGNPGEELACVAIGEGRVVAYGGSTALAPIDRTDIGQVTCVDLADGTVRWQVKLPLLGLLANGARDENADIFDGLFPSGEPVIDGGTAYVFARKLTAQLETVEYLLAFDLRSGALRFATYLCSSSFMPRVSSRPASRPVLANGSIYVSSAVGAVARVDASDGRVRWVHRSMVPMRELRYRCEPWELGGPVLLGDSLFAISPDQSEVVQYEAESGRRVQSFVTGPTEAWGTPRYLLVEQRSEGDGGRAARVYSVGADVIAIDPENPKRALWAMSKANATLFEEREGVANRSGIRGRVQLAGDLVVVPGLRDVLLVNLDRGRVKESIEIDGPANPLLVGPQLFLGQNSSLTALMPASSAERVMRSRIAASPSDPEGALALLDLGLRTKRLDLCADAAAAAREALQRSAPEEHRSAPAELVERLLRALRLEEASGDAGDAVLAIFGDVARTSAQRVRHALARAEWLERRRRFTEAMTTLGAVLDDSNLASVAVDDDNWTVRPAATLAAERLGALARQAPDVFAERDAAARAQLAAAGEDIDKLRDLATASTATGSSAALEAMNRLARALDRANEPLAALAVAMRGLRALPDDSAGAAPLVETALAIGQARGWSRWATQFADALARRFPAAKVGDGRTLAQLASGPGKPLRLGATAGEGFEISGRLLRFDENPEGGDVGRFGTPGRFAPRLDTLRRLNGILVIVDHDLMLIDATTLKARWTTRVEDRDPAVLLVGGPIGDAALLLQMRNDGSSFATIVSLADGATLGTLNSLKEALPPEATLMSPRSMLRQMPDGSRFNPDDLATFVSGRMLVFVRGNGDAAGFDLGNLAKPVWTASGLLAEVYRVAANDFAVGLGGRERGDDTEATAALVVLDPATGTVLARSALEGGEDVRWLHMAPTGELVAGTGKGIQAIDALAALGAPTAGAAADAARSLLWSNASVNARDTIEAWRLGEWLATTDHADDVTAIALRDGHVDRSRFELPPRMGGRSSTLAWAGRVGDAALLQFEDHLVAFDGAGALVGEDALLDKGIDEGSFIFLLPTQEGVVAVRTSGSRQVQWPISGGMRTEFPYLIYRLSIADGLRLLGPALQVRLTQQRCERISAVDGVLFFSTPSQTIAVPLP